MPLNKKQSELLASLIHQGVLSKPDISVGPLPKLRKLPPLTQAPIDNQKSDYASYLLAKSMGNKGVQKALGRSIASTENAADSEQSFMSKLFDTLMIPNYTMANIGDAIAQGTSGDEGFLGNLGQELTGVGKALAGGAVRAFDATFANPFEKIPGAGQHLTDWLKSTEESLAPKQTFSNVLDKNFGIDGPAGIIGGLGLDIVTDPTTYIGGLGLAGKLKKAKDVVEAPAETLTSKAAVAGNTAPFIAKPMAKPSVAEEALKGNPSIDRNFFGQIPQLPKQDVKSLLPDPNLGIPRTRGLKRRPLPKNLEVPTPTRSIEEKMVRRQADFERAMTKVGKVAETSSKINMRSVNNVIRKIQDGEIPRVLPKVEPATGDVAVVARDVADEYIDKLMGQKFNPNTLRWHSPSGKMISRKLPPEMPAGQQVKMFYEILGKTGPKNLSEAISMLRASEDHLITLGVQPIRHEGVRVRLSDVLKLTEGKVLPSKVLEGFAAKSMKNVDPVVREAIQTVAAYRSMAMSDILENVTKYAQKATDAVSQSYVGRQAAAAEDNILNTAVEHAAAMGGTREELKAALNLIKDVVKLDKIPAENFLNSVSKELVKAVDDGRAQPEIIAKFNDLVAQSLGITSKNLQTKISGSNVVDTVMTAFTTWWGKGKFLQEAKGTFEAGRLNADARAEALRKLSQSFTKDEIKTAWKYVVGNVDGDMVDPRVEEMASFFRGYMDEVLKVPSYGMHLENAATKHLSVAERSQMFMRDVNAHLKQMNGVNAFQFTDKAITRDAWEVKRNFSASGEGWQASWARWDPEDPLKTLYDIDLALERTTKEYAFLDNFVFNFGSLTRTPMHDYKIEKLGRIKDFYVPKDVARQMERVMDDVHKGNWTPNSPLGRFHQKALRIWKTGVTIYLPSHHIRNGIGDTYLMWLAGHNDPRAFIWGKRIMHSQKGRYKQAIDSGDFQTLSQLTDPNAMKWAMTNGKDVILNQKGTKVTADQLYISAWHRGLLKNANQLEDIFGESRIGFKPLGGKVHDAATTAAEYREHFIRLSHYTSAVNKSLKRGRKDLEKIFDDAAAEVRKWHPDGTDLTRFEQKYMRSVVPFYSWIRKSTPLLVESLVTRPAKALVYPRLNTAIQNLVGIDATVADPFPKDQLFPEWIKSYGIGPIGDAESPNPFSKWWGLLGKNMLDITGNPYGYTVVNPSNPLIDAGQQFGGMGLKDTGQGVLGSLSPFLKVPTELMADKQVSFTGAPISKEAGGRGVVNYLLKQFPQTAPAQRVFDWGENKNRVGREPGMDKEALINMLTALGLHGTAPYIKGAEFEQKAKAKAKNQ